VNAPVRMPPVINQDDHELVLQLFRMVSRRVKEIDAEIMFIGTVLDQKRILPREAIEWLEEVAPGCIGTVYLSLFKQLGEE